MDLLTLSNTKTLKGQKKGYMTFVLHLAPADSAGLDNLCPKASPGCRASCLNYAGRGQMNSVQKGRIRKARWFVQDREGFMEALVEDVRKAIVRAENKGFEPVFRLNGTSDVLWERIPVALGQTVYSNIFAAYPDRQFYDYTKILKRKIAGIPNYHLTFSRSENNDKDCARAVETGMNVAAVFESQPATWLGRPVVDGDDSDLRFLDPQNVIVGLTAKGRARKEDTGFVIRVQHV